MLVFDANEESSIPAGGFLFLHQSKKYKISFSSKSDPYAAIFCTFSASVEHELSIANSAIENFLRQMDITTVRCEIFTESETRARELCAKKN